MARRPAFERNDLADGIHNGRVRRDRPPNHVVGVVHVNDYDLALLADFFADTDKSIRFHGQRVEPGVFPRSRESARVARFSQPKTFMLTQCWQH